MQQFLMNYLCFVYNYYVRRGAIATSEPVFVDAPAVFELEAQFAGQENVEIPTFPVELWNVVDMYQQLTCN